MLITTKGQMVRTRISEIRAVGRNTMGVKLMDLRGTEKLQAIAPVVSQAEEEAEPQKRRRKSPRRRRWGTVESHASAQCARNKMRRTFGVRAAA